MRWAAAVVGLDGRKSLAGASPYEGAGGGGG